MRPIVVSIALASIFALSSGPLWAVKLGDTCDGIAALRCDEALWCEYPPGQCRVADAAGRCVKEPGVVCTKDYLPVCGCDGKTYGNDCERRAAQAQLDHVGECAK